MARFIITIKVDYDEATMPEEMEHQLSRNVERCIQRSNLLNDSGGEVIVDQYSMEVERK